MEPIPSYNQIELGIILYHIPGKEIVYILNSEIRFEISIEGLFEVTTFMGRKPAKFTCRQMDAMKEVLFCLQQESLQIKEEVINENL